MLKPPPLMRCLPNTEYLLNVHHIPNTYKTHTNVQHMFRPYYLKIGEHRMFIHKFSANNAYVEGALMPYMNPTKIFVHSVQP